MLCDVQTDKVLRYSEIMAVVPAVPVLLIVLVAQCRCEPTNKHGYNNDGNDASQLGAILKPPPPPPLPIFPVPFHGGTGRLRQNNDQEYQYQSPPPPPPPAPLITPSPELKFPAPFYKQYNFNFVPSPQPFTTTPSQNLFQKISGWLFSSQQSSSDIGSEVTNTFVSPLKRDCNPCNLVPWIPVIRYDLASKSIRQSINPTYGPPSSTTTTNFINAPKVSKPFHNINKATHMSSGVPHVNYGPPHLNSNQFRSQSSTYGPPSPTHTVSVSNEASSYSQPSNSLVYEIPNTSLGPFSTYSSSFNQHYDSTHNLLNNYNNQFVSTSHNPISTNYKPEILNQKLPTQNDVDVISYIEPSQELKLPKVSHPTGFRNSYGEPIVNTYALDIPYSVSAAGAASSKIKTEVLPDYTPKVLRQNMSVALANPAPFSLNRGRNIHTLQPVALPNLSVSPLPPIFNARPFRTVTTNHHSNLVHGINHLQNPSNNINIEKSVPVAEYTHSIEYPTTVIQSPVIDIEKIKNLNQSETYRNVGNSYEIDEIPQASEDHLSAAKSNHDSSFESIGIGFTNDLYDGGIPLDLKESLNAPFNHKVSFADLRGVKDEDVDKYRTESNLQYIDSPLLYLKPSAPHKNFKNFIFTTTSTPGKQNEYEIYDEYIPTTMAPTQSTNGVNENRNDYIGELSHSTAEAEDKNRPKIVQIIVPYTSGLRVNDNKNSFSNIQQDFTEEDYVGRKVPSNTENTFYTLATEGISSIMTTTEEPMTTITEHYDTERINTPTILNDLYDVKEPPFDIIKLQHTIDDWTEQEYSKHYRIPPKARPNEKFAKQIPDDYFTTISPITNYVTERSYNYDLYDHEFSSSIQHTVTENRTDFYPITRKEYNTIERTKVDHSSDKNEESEGNEKLHIYTAASTFRKTTTTTPAPWGLIQTSISPLTNEKVYVVTSKPWREKNFTKEYEYEDENYNSQKKELDDSSETDLPFKSPRFSNRPSYGFTADAIDSIRLDSPYGFSKGWHRRINNLQSVPFSQHTTTYDEDIEKESPQSTKTEEKKL